jgi:hypothetical protein
LVRRNAWYKKWKQRKAKKELDELKSLGITNLRVMATAEGGDQDYTVIPATQPTQGKYNQDLLEGLDFFLNELKKRYGCYSLPYQQLGMERRNGKIFGMEWLWKSSKPELKTEYLASIYELYSTISPM